MNKDTLPLKSKTWFCCSNSTLESEHLLCDDRKNADVNSIEFIKTAPSTR